MNTDDKLFFQMDIGDSIKRIRKEKGMTQKQLATDAGVSETSIRKYEAGKREPKKEAVQKIAKALGVDPFSLYSFDMATQVLEEDINTKMLLRSYRKLNDAGQTKVLIYAGDLTKIPDYRKDTPD